MDLETLQQALGVRFNQPELLRRALRHRSYLNENAEKLEEDNERLEFLGDAVLDFVSADFIYRRFPDLTEGQMTQLRSALVRTESLAILAKELHLGDLLLMAKGEVVAGGRERATLLADAFEAMIGAIYLDQGLEQAKRIIIPRLNTRYEAIASGGQQRDYRSRFQEWVQAHYGDTPNFELIRTDGPEHDKLFTVAAFIGDKIIAEGTARNKRLAAQEAARIALEKVMTDGET